MNSSFLLGFLNASAFAALFVCLFLFGLYVVARATRPTSMPKYDWDREPLFQRGALPGAMDRPRIVRPQERAPQLDL